MRSSSSVNLVAYFVLISCFGLSAQISITSEDLLNLIGKTQVLDQDSSIISIDLGASGANQIWDHRNIAFQAAFSITASFEGIVSNPFANDFSSANLVQHNTNDLIDGDQYLFYKVEPDKFTGLGDAFNFTTGGMDFDQIDQGETLEAPLPLTIGEEWNSIVNDTFSQAGITIINYDSTVNLVDGWGTLRLPLGDFECLRIKSKSYCTTTTEFGGNSTSETDSEITYVWLSKSNFILSTVSHENAEEENFTNSEFYSRISSVSGSTSLKDQLAIEGVAVKLFPNPFIDRINIEIELDRDMPLKVEIIDLNQKSLSTLIDGQLRKGLHNLAWHDREQISAAHYFIKIITPQGVVMRPIMKMR